MFSETSILDFCFSLGALVIDLKSGESKKSSTPQQKPAAVLSFFTVAVVFVNSLLQ